MAPRLRWRLSTELSDVQSLLIGAREGMRINPVSGPALRKPGMTHALAADPRFIAIERAGLV